MKVLKICLRWLVFAVIILIVTGASFYWIYMRPFFKQMAHTTVIQYDKNLTIELGGGGNSGILESDSLILVIDTKQYDAARQFANMVKRLAKKRPILVVNTHYHSDHVEGNHFFAGYPILAGGNYTNKTWVSAADMASLPTVWLKDSLVVPMGDELVTVLNIPAAAHTESDVVVYLHRRKLLFTGDIVLNKQAPALVSAAANPDGYIAAMELLQNRFAIQKIVPGHGQMGGIEILRAFRQYFLDMRVAANDANAEKQLLEKYKDWLQIPFIMSPDATIHSFKNIKSK